MSDIVRTLLLVSIIATLGCDQAEQAGTSVSDGFGQDLTKLTAEELSQLTDSRITAMGDDYSNADYTKYDEAVLAHGAVYKRYLIKRIEDSDRITITEHSDQMDFVDDSDQLPEKYPFYEYKTVSLTEEQRSAFLEVVKAMDGDTVKARWNCIFEPHHRIQFFSGETASSTMSICFRCQQVSWDEVNLDHPEGLIRALHILIEQVGFQSNRDWKALAKQRSEQAEDGNSVPATR